MGIRSSLDRDMAGNRKGFLKLVVLNSDSDRFCSHASMHWSAIPSGEYSLKETEIPPDYNGGGLNLAITISHT